MPDGVRNSAQARAAIDLAQRLDGEDAASVAVLLARELRMAMTELHRQAKGDASHEVEEFLRRVSAPSLGDGAH